jgi:RNA polymerase sigma-70 factor (ECF subfamily)
MNNDWSDLQSYAYHIVGSVEDARDIVQGTLLHIFETDTSHVDNKDFYIRKAVINRSIDFRRKKQNRASHYPGTWLPEPVETNTALTAMERRDMLRYSLLVLLEKLEPRPRAVFILKEAFGYSHEEIAAVLDISASLSRQILSRAKKELRVQEMSRSKRIKSGYLNQFLQVLEKGDLPTIEQWLSNDITLVSDGGGKVKAARLPIHGQERAAKFMTGIYHKFYRQMSFRITTINRQPSICWFEGDQVVNCLVFNFRDGLISEAYYIRNPDKLKHLRGLMAE